MTALALRLAILNVNGAQFHKNDIITLLNSQSLDVLLLNETHFNDNNVFKVKNYNIYRADHPTGKARGGSAVIIASHLMHNEEEHFVSPAIQACNVAINVQGKKVILSAVYCPPGKAGVRNFSPEHFRTFLNSLGPNYIVGGDFNAKHHSWNSRHITPRGRIIRNIIDEVGAIAVAGTQPTYWPTDIAKTPDLLDFFITKGLSSNYLLVEDTLDIPSDHSMVVLNWSVNAIFKKKLFCLHNKTTNWNIFRQEVDTKLEMKIPLKTQSDVDKALCHFNEVITNALISSTAQPSIVVAPKNVSLNIRRLLQAKKNARKAWHRTHDGVDKTRLNRMTRQLSQAIKEESDTSFQEFTESLSPHADSDYSLYRVTKAISRPRIHTPPLLTSKGWARSPIEKADALASHLVGTFKPHSRTPHLITLTIFFLLLYQWIYQLDQ